MSSCYINLFTIFYIISCYGAHIFKVLWRLFRGNKIKTTCATQQWKTFFVLTTLEYFYYPYPSNVLVHCCYDCLYAPSLVHWIEIFYIQVTLDKPHGAPVCINTCEHQKQFLLPWERFVRRPNKPVYNRTWMALWVIHKSAFVWRLREIKPCFEFVCQMFNHSCQSNALFSLNKAPLCAEFCRISHLVV